MSGNLSEKYRREIEEILQQTEGLPGRPRRRRGGRRLAGGVGRALGRATKGQRWGLTPGRLMLGAVALLFSAVLFRSIAPGLVGPVAWAGLVLFIVAYAMFFLRPGPTVEKRWRGRMVEDHTPWWHRVGRRRR